MTERCAWWGESAGLELTVARVTGFLHFGDLLLRVTVGGNRSM